MATEAPPGLIDRDPSELSSSEAILLAALGCFLEKGYHGTTIREIATRAGVSVPGLYHHFASKLALLECLIDQTMDDLIAQTEAALAGAGRNPVAQLEAVVVAHVHYHCERPEESFIGNSELRSLSPEGRKRIVAKRDHQQRIFDRVVEVGVAAGSFDVDAPHEASRAIVTMCTAVASWYHRDGPAAAEEIVAIYRDLALNLVQAEDRTARHAGASALA